MYPFFEIGTYIQMQGERITQPLGTLPLEGLDHVSYAYGSIDENGAMARPIKAGPLAVSLVFDSAILQQLTKPQKLQNFLNSLNDLTEVTFEIKSQVPASFVELCQKISEKIPLKLALPGNVTELEKLDLTALNPYISSYDLLAYDYHTPQENKATQFHTLLADRHRPCAENTLSFLQNQGIDLRKINLGLASYGKLYKNVPPGPEGNGYEQEAKGVQLVHPNLPYRDIEAYILANPSAKVYYTSLDGVVQSFIYNAANGDWISFDDPDTLKGKVQWAQERGLHGAFLWSSDQDNSTFSELKAVEKGSGRKSWTKI